MQDKGQRRMKEMKLKEELQWLLEYDGVRELSRRGAIKTCKWWREFGNEHM